MYRYRYDRGASRFVLDRVKKHLAKVGTVLSVRGYRYFGRYNTDHEAVMIKGDMGSLRLSGCCWGYSGEGPRMVREVLMHLGVSERIAETLAFRAFRKDELGTDWELQWKDDQLIQTWIPNRFVA